MRLVGDSMSAVDILALTLAPVDPSGISFDDFKFRSIAGGEAAAINGPSVIAFAAGIDAQTQEDILYSFQIANRAADGVAKADTEMDAWFHEYARVLKLTGWTGTSLAPQQQNTTEGDVELAKEALGIITAAMGGVAPLILQAALKAMEQMADDSGFIKLFDHFGKKGSIGNFQLGQVDRGAAGELVMTAGAFLMKMKETRQKWWIVKWRRQDVSVWADAQKLVFSKAQYADVRAAVVKQIGATANDGIADLKLG